MVGWHPGWISGATGRQVVSASAVGAWPLIPTSPGLDLHERLVLRLKRKKDQDWDGIWVVVVLSLGRVVVEVGNANRRKQDRTECLLRKDLRVILT